MPTIVSFFDVLLSHLETLAPYIISAISVFAVFHNTNASRKIPLNSSYLSMLTEAYAAYLSSIANFVYRHDDKSRDELISCLYKVNLLGTKEIANQATELFAKLTEWSKSGNYRYFPHDDLVSALQQAMSSDLILLKKKGHR